MDHIQCHWIKLKGVKIGGYAAGIVGGCALVGAVFTGGLTLPLAVTGFGGAAASAGANVGADVWQIVSKDAKMTKVNELVEEDQRVTESMRNMFATVFGTGALVQSVLIHVAVEAGKESTKVAAVSQSVGLMKLNGAV